MGQSKNWVRLQWETKGCRTCSEWALVEHLSIRHVIIMSSPVQDKVTKHRCPVFVLGQKIKREIKIGDNAMPFDCIGFLIGFSLEPVLVVSAPHPLPINWNTPACGQATWMYQNIPVCTWMPDCTWTISIISISGQEPLLCDLVLVGSEY